MPEVVLSGCTPEPLMSYLKALGVFRLVAEQADSEATLSWSGGFARLNSKLDREQILNFFSGDYRPTPVLAPWNGGSGFYGGGAEPLDHIANSADARFSLYRNTIARIRSFVPETKPKDDEKENLLIRCRAELPDEVVPWLDTCFVVGEDGPSYFPLLGTGGNDGRLDFTNNFMQRLADVLPVADNEEPSEKSIGWLDTALYAENLTPLCKSAIGQFNPGGIGGANGTQGRFEADSRVNPWDFVLMIEGVLLFAGSLARRMGATTIGRSVFPFSVDSVAVGYGSATASEETSDGSRAELWLPLWEQQATLSEVSHLFAEGRAQLGRRQARNAVEFALAVSLLGVSRGVSAFTRYGFLKRNGLAFLAAPLGRLAVTPRPAARLLDDPPLTEWLDRFRSACRDKDKTPARYQTALRQIDRAMFNFANRSESGESADRRELLNVLRALGKAERTLAGGLAFCADKYLRPLQRLSKQWLDQANDGSSEFRLAASIAGIPAEKAVGPLRTFLEEVETKGPWANWSPGSTSAVWSTRTLADNLAAVFRRRQLEAFRDGQTLLPTDLPYFASLADVVAFLNEDQFDDEKFEDLLWALSALNWSDVERYLPDADETEVPFEFGVTRLLIQPRAFHFADGRWRLTFDVPVNAIPDPEVFHTLASGKRDAVTSAIDRAARRLKSTGLLVIGYRNRQRAGQSLAVTSPFPPNRLLAACRFPLTARDLDQIANAVFFPPDIEE